MDPAFFEQMAMPLFDQLYNFAHWLTGNSTDAEDLVQETYAKALKGIRSFAEGTNFRAWMYSILRNTFLTSRTGLAARNTFALEDETGEIQAADAQTPESVLLQKESEQAVMDALAGMPVLHREMILLCEMEEMSYKEIAEVLSIPLGTVMSRLARARAMLRRAIQSTPGKEA